MSVFSDDFSSYSVGAGVSPPWINIGLGSKVIAGGFRGQGLQYQPSGGIRRNLQAVYESDISIYFYCNFPSQHSYSANILELLNGDTPDGAVGISLFVLGFEQDGTLTISGPGKRFDNSGSNLGFSLYFNQWYFFQVNVKFDIGAGGFVTVEAKVAVDALTVCDSSGPQLTTQLVSGLINGVSSINKVDFHDITDQSIIDEILCNTPRDTIPNYPNPTAGFKARATQLVIENANLPDSSFVRMTQGIIEHADLPDTSKVRITQMIIEIATARGPAVAGGWTVKEA